MQNSSRGNQRTQGEVSSPPTVELEDKQTDGEGSGASAMAQGSILRLEKRIRTEKEKEKDAARKKMLRAKIRANDPSIPKKTVDREKNRRKKKMEQYYAVLDNDETKDKELERLRDEL